MAAPLILARTFKDAHSYAQDVLGLSIGYYRVVNSPGTIKAVRGRELHLVPGWDKRPDRFSMKSAIRFCRNTVIDVAALRAEEAVVHGHIGGEALHDVSPDSETTDEESEVTCAACLEIIETLPRREPTIQITVVPDETPTPQHHLDMVARVLPNTSNGDNMVAEGSPVTTDFFDEPEVAEETATCVDCGLDEHAEDCPQAPAPKPAEAPKRGRRRSRCKTCGNLHYKEDPCPEGDD